jgi:hypothetical protein
VRETEKPIAVVARELGIDEGTIRDWLIKDKDAPRKQRHTARRIRQRLVEERGEGSRGRFRRVPHRDRWGAGMIRYDDLKPSATRADVTTVLEPRKWFGHPLGGDVHQGHR